MYLARIIRLCNNWFLNYQNLCPKCTQWLRRDATSATLTIYCSNCTAVIRGVELFVLS